jgi:UDP-N-acetylmuramoylalanine--D-glutamate ligase
MTTLPRAPEFLRYVLPGPAAVLGGGVSGAGALELLARVGGEGVVFDENLTDQGLVNNFGPQEAAARPLVIHSPGFPKGHRWLRIARESGGVCLGELDFAAAFWPGRILAVTGTNGKTTLTEFLAHALRTIGIDAVATGNIGFPFSRLTAETLAAAEDASNRVAVCEVSSFQAESLEHLNPDATLWTNFAEDHLERHASMQDYFAAKWKLASRTRRGGLILGESAWRFAVGAGIEVPEESKVFSEGKTQDEHLSGTIFACPPQRENYLLAETWWHREGHPESALLAAARTFRPGRHRLSRVATVDGVTWWNDSKATNFHAVEAALRSFPRPVLLIAGGRSKGGDLVGFVRRIAPQVRAAYLIGETSSALSEAMRAANIENERCMDLAEAVRRAALAARPTDHVLLSPGFPSFDMFRSYEDRGNRFEALVNNLGVNANFC